MVFNFSTSSDCSPAVSEPKGQRLLSDLRPGSLAVIEWVDAASPLGRRLQDLGFVANTEVKLVRLAPLGDPAEYEVRGTRFCLRRSEASRVRVRPR